MTESSVSNRLAVRGGAVALFTYFALCIASLTSAGARADDGELAKEWLERMNRAAKEVSYVGSFVYLHDGMMETMLVARRVGDVVRERLYSLTGAAREIIRDEEMVWCYLPDQKIGVHEYRQAAENTFPHILPQDADYLDRHYEMSAGGTSRIADREARLVSIMPRDRFRYGYDLWADEQSGLLLRADLLSPEGDRIEQYMFVEIDIGANVSDAQLSAVTPKEELSWYGVSEKQKDDKNGVMEWTVGDLPVGFNLATSIKRVSPMRGMPVEHHVYTDGLASVSIFIEEPGSSKGPMIEGASSMGAVSAFGRNVDGHQITVVGEVPETTVRMIGMSVRHL